MRRYLLLVAGLALCGPALGQNAPRIEISPTIGYFYGGDLFDSRAEPFRASVHDHLDYGLRAGWLASPHWSFEFDWTRVPTRVDVTNSDPVPLDIDFLTPRVVYHFATGCFRPYVAAGWGGGIFDTGDTGGKGYFTGTMAVGLKAFLTPNFGARIEGRGFASAVGDPPLGFACTTFDTGGPGDSVVPVSCAHTWILSADVTAGLVFAF